MLGTLEYPYDLTLRVIPVFPPIFRFGKPPIISMMTPVHNNPPYMQNAILLVHAYINTVILIL